ADAHRVGDHLLEVLGDVRGDCDGGRYGHGTPRRARRPACFRRGRPPAHQGTATGWGRRVSLPGNEASRGGGVRVLPTATGKPPEAPAVRGRAPPACSTCSAEGRPGQTSLGPTF